MVADQRAADINLTVLQRRMQGLRARLLGVYMLADEAVCLSACMLCS